MSIKLRPYQDYGIEEVRNALRGGAKSVCMVAPTGAGKTTIAGKIIEGAESKGSHVLFAAHRKELIDQCSDRLTDFEIDHGVIRSGVRPRESLVQVASIQTLVNRELPRADLVIFDECHRAKAAQYQAIIEAYPMATLIGLTATPCRLDGRGLGDIFQALVEVAKIDFLIQEGYLITPRVYVPFKPSLEALRVNRGDYAMAELANIMDKAHLVGDIVRTWLRLARGLRTVAFCTTVEHSIHLRNQFLAVGVKAAHLDGKTPERERAAILAGLKSGEIEVVCNVGILTEGWDLPCLECIVLARPTASLSLYMQMVGRVLRPGGRACLVLDHAGCTLDHGLATDPREWSLEGLRKKKGTGGMSLKNCPQCFAVVRTGTPSCPECGYGWGAIEVCTEGNIIQTIDGALIEYKPSEPRHYCRPCQVFAPASLGACPRCGEPLQKHWLERHLPLDPRNPTQQEKRALFMVLKDMAIAKNYRKGWAARQYKEVFGIFPVGVDDTRPWPCDADNLKLSWDQIREINARRKKHG